MIPRPTACGGATARGRTLRRAPAALSCILAALFIPSAVEGAQTLQVIREGSAVTRALEARPARPDFEHADAMVRKAVALAGEGALDRAGTVLSLSLDRWPDHPGLLGELAGLRLRQGRAAEAEGYATRLVGIDPTSEHGWEMLAASRYLQDDTRGALRAWRHGDLPVVRQTRVHVIAHAGPRTTDTGTDPVRLTGIVQGRPLTVEDLVQGERRLAALPAAARARLGYRMLSGRDASLEGTVVLGASNPFGFPELAAHALRVLGGRVHLVSSDPLGRLERWEFSGSVEGRLQSVALALAHPAPYGPGVWHWNLDHGVGHYASSGQDTVVREQRTGIAWSQVDWITARLRGAVHGRVDVRPGRGTFAGVGTAWTFLPLSERTTLRVEGTGWTKVGGGPSDVAGSAEGVGVADADEAVRFGRLAARMSLHPPDPPGGAAPSGLSLRGGIVMVSPGAPDDLLPRIGAGANTSVLMRARSDLDEDGIVRPLLPGRTWVHGGVEVLRGVGSVGPVGLGVAAFADAARVLGRATTSAGHGVRRGAVHLGVGMRVRVPGVAGWLRADWGVDPFDGGSVFSAAWVPGGTS